MHRDAREDRKQAGGGSAHLLLELLVDRQIGGPLRGAPVGFAVGAPVLLRLPLLLAPESGLPEPLEILRKRRDSSQQTAPERGGKRETAAAKQETLADNLPLLRGGALRPFAGCLPLGPGGHSERDGAEPTSGVLSLGPPRTLGKEGHGN